MIFLGVLYANLPFRNLSGPFTSTVQHFRSIQSLLPINVKVRVQLSTSLSVSQAPAPDLFWYRRPSQAGLPYGSWLPNARPKRFPNDY